MQEAQQKRIMVIDDSPTVRESASALLAKCGFEVLLCVDGFDALSKIAGFSPDLVFTDVEMPFLDGYETITLIRSNPSFNNIPLVMLSSRSGIFNVAKGRLIGCSDYLTKPFSQESLEEVLERYLPGAMGNGANMAA